MIFTRISFGRLAGLATLAAFLFACPFASFAESFLPPARDLFADAKSVERSGLPLIVMVSLRGCPHCEVVRRSHLLPLVNNQSAKQVPLIRQVEMNGPDGMRDFSGRATTHGEFAKHYKITVVPVVMFFDEKGERLAQSLVGAMIPDFYGAYFEAALAEAKSMLEARSRN